MLDGKREITDGKIKENAIGYFRRISLCTTLETGFNEEGRKGEKGSRIEEIVIIRYYGCVRLVKEY